MDSRRSGRSGPPGEEATPVGINVAAGAMAIVLATFLADRVPLGDSDSAQALMAVTVGVFAACTVAPAALALLLAPTWMLMNGFLVNRSGDLSWHGSADVYRFLLLAGAGGLGLALGALVRQLRDLQQRWRLGFEAQAMSTDFMSTEIMPKESRSREFGSRSAEFASGEFMSREFDEERHRA